MSRATPVLVTGAVGNVGREVVRAMAARGQPVRAADLSISAIRAMHGLDLEATRLDFEDASTFDRALADCEAIFLVRPPAVVCMESTLLPFIDAALARGVKHIVFLSVAGAATNKLVPHHAVEKHLEPSGASHTLLRPGFFAQNLGSAYRDDIAPESRSEARSAPRTPASPPMRDVTERSLPEV
jgi:uncharacterized protein YbjT (DUF2867 family)